MIRKFSLCCLLFSLLILEASGAVFLKAESGTTGCTDENGNLKKENETWLIKGQCQKAECKLIGGKYFQQIFGCGKIIIGEGCKEVSDMTALYPDCCPRGQCN